MISHPGPHLRVAGLRASEALIGKPFIPGQRLPSGQAGQERRPSPEFNSICTCSQPGSAPRGGEHTPLFSEQAQGFYAQSQRGPKSGSWLGSSTRLSPEAGSGWLTLPPPALNPCCAQRIDPAPGPCCFPGGGLQENNPGFKPQLGPATHLP